jgi:hypothetical protein
MIAGVECCDGGECSGLSRPSGVVKIGDERDSARVRFRGAMTPEKQMRKIRGGVDGAAIGECGKTVCGGEVARPDPCRVGAKIAYFRQGELGGGLHADAEEEHRLRLHSSRAKGRFLHQVIDEPAGEGALKRRATEPEPEIAFGDAACAGRFVIGEPLDLRKSQAQGIERERDARREACRRREGAKRTEKPGEHKIVAEIPSAVEVVPEMNPHAQASAANQIRRRARP